MIKRILVGLGGQDYTLSAIQQAVALAQAHDAELTGVSVIDEERLANMGPVPIGGGAYAHELAEKRLAEAKQRAEFSVKSFLEACTAGGVKHYLKRDIGEPFEDMIDQARYHDLMIFGLKSIFEYDIIDDPHNVLVRLVQSGVRPLIAVSKGFTEVKKVLVAYSGSMESAKAMKHFVQMRLWPDVTMRVITFEDGLKDAQQLLTDAATYCQAHGFNVETELVPGSPKEHLLPYAAKWGADLTVIGNSAKNLLMRRLFGETALHAIRNSDRPLFLAQ